MKIARQARRSRRRARTLPGKASAEERASWAHTPIEAGIDRPRRRGDCQDSERPCPFVGCAAHLYLDVSPGTGALKLNFPDLEPWELEQTCALDVADRGGVTLEEAGLYANVSRERIRQVEVSALVKLRAARIGEEDPLPGELGPVLR